MTEPVVSEEVVDAYRRGMWNHDCDSDPDCCIRQGLVAAAKVRDRLVAAQVLREAADDLEAACSAPMVHVGPFVHAGHCDYPDAAGILRRRAGALSGPQTGSDIRSHQPDPENGPTCATGARNELSSPIATPQEAHQ